MEFHGTPTQTQLKHLKELVLQHRKILISNADDEPLKQRLWSLIADELNSMDDGPLLEPNVWKAYINLEEYRSKWGKKSYQKPATDQIREDITMEQNKRIKVEPSENKEKNERYVDSEQSVEEDTTNDELNALLTSDDELEADDLESLLNSIDSDSNTDDEMLNEFENAKNVINLKTQLKTTPLVKSFKFSKRMLENVDQLNAEVTTIQEQMKSTAKALNNIEQLLQKQCVQQAETNALLKRNCQLTKILVEQKLGRRAKKMKEMK